MTRPPFVRAMFPILAAVLAIATSAAADETVTMTESTKLTQTDRQAINAAGVELLRNVSLAQQALEKGDLPVARRHTGIALGLADQIRWSSPSGRLRDLVRAARQNYKRTGKFDSARDLQPIMAELDTTTLTNKDSIRTSMGKLETAATKGQNDQVDDALVQVQEQIAYSEVDLKIDEVDRALSRARYALAHHEQSTAAAELRTAADQVQVVVANVSVDGTADSGVSEGPPAH